MDTAFPQPEQLPRRYLAPRSLQPADACRSLPGCKTSPPSVLPSSPSPSSSSNAILRVSSAESAANKVKLVGVRLEKWHRVRHKHAVCAGCAVLRSYNADLRSSSTSNALVVDAFANPAAAHVVKQQIRVSPQATLAEERRATLAARHSVHSRPNLRRIHRTRRRTGRTYRRRPRTTRPGSLCTSLPLARRRHAPAGSPAPVNCCR